MHTVATGRQYVIINDRRETFSAPIQTDQAPPGGHQQEGGRQLVGRPVFYITNMNAMGTPWGHKHHFPAPPTAHAGRRKELTGAIQSGLHP